MALADGNAVAYHVDLAATTSYAMRDGNFVFGVVEAQAGVDVLWSNGTKSDGIDGNALDKITPLDSALSGKLLQFGADSAQFVCILVRAYQRQQNGTGSNPNFALVRLVATGQLVELLLAALSVAANQ